MAGSLLSRIADRKSGDTGRAAVSGRRRLGERALATDGRALLSWEMVPVRVYTTTSCGYCVMAKALLAKRSVPYQEIDVTFDDAKRAWLVQATRRRTVPQIFIGETPIGGYDELAKLDRSGRLAELLASPSEAT